MASCVAISLMFVLELVTGNTTTEARLLGLLLKWQMLRRLHMHWTIYDIIVLYLRADFLIKTRHVVWKSCYPACCIIWINVCLLNVWLLQEHYDIKTETTGHSHISAEYGFVPESSICVTNAMLWSRLCLVR